MDLRTANDSESRFVGYVEGLVSVIGHADRAGPLRDYCVGLMLPCERKSVEPMAAVTAPERVGGAAPIALAFCRQCGIGRTRECWPRCARWCCLRIERHGPIEAWIIDDTGFPQARAAFGRGSAAILRPAWQARQLSGRGVAVGCQSPCQPAGGLSAVFAARLGDKIANVGARRVCLRRLASRPSQRLRLNSCAGRVRPALPRGVVLMDASYGAETDLRTNITTLGLSYVAGT